MKDDYAIVLDYLEHGKPGRKDEPMAQVVGTDNFSLLEVAVREDHRLKTGDKVYIGDGDREDVKYIKGRITSDELTSNADSELEYILDDLIEENEEEFVSFFNDAQPVTTRRHALELLPSVGKKHMRQMIDEREKGDFESFDDITERVDLLPDPRKLVKKRMLEEYEGDRKRYIFVAPPGDESRKKMIRR